MIDFLKQIFGDEALTFDQLSERVEADASLNIVNIADGAYVPKSDFDAVNDQLTEANAKAAQYADFDQLLQAAKDEGAAQLAAYKRDVEISRELAAAHVSDEVSVKANLDLNAVKLGEDEKLTGLSDQLAALKESKPYLFNEPQPKLELGGSTPGANSSGAPKGIEAAVADYYNN